MGSESIPVTKLGRNESIALTNERKGCHYTCEEKEVINTCGEQVETNQYLGENCD
jgi:hypothetical protein